MTEYEKVSPNPVAQRQCDKITVCHAGCRDLDLGPDGDTVTVTGTSRDTCGTRCEHKTETEDWTTSATLGTNFGFASGLGSGSGRTRCSTECRDADPLTDLSTVTTMFPEPDTDSITDDDFTCRVASSGTVEYPCTVVPRVLTYGETAADCALADGTPYSKSVAALRDDVMVIGYTSNKFCF